MEQENSARGRRVTQTQSKGAVQATVPYRNRKASDTALKPGFKGEAAHSPISQMQCGTGGQRAPFRLLHSGGCWTAGHQAPGASHAAGHR